MKKIVIKTVPKSKIRNDGVGDYKDIKGGIEIMVAKMNDGNAEAEVAIHEFVEAILAKKRKISFKKIDKFDREHREIKGEPGELKNSPYKKEHAIANKIEKVLAKELKKNA